MKEITKKLLIVGIICLLLGSFVGYVWGSISTIYFGVRISKSFMNISFDEKEIASAIFRYKNQIGECYK